MPFLFEGLIIAFGLEQGPFLACSETTPFFLLGLKQCPCLALAATKPFVHDGLFNAIL
jgi:hypothetical protein